MGLQPKRKLRVILGTIKDSASLLSSAASPSPAATAVLRATTHHPSSPPVPRHLNALLAFGRGARPVAAAAVADLVARLRATHDAAVVLKCLLAVHHLARHGSFILRDQLAAALLQPPAGGGRNPLNMSGFRNGATPESWGLSGWVRWYAAVLEQLLSCQRAMRFFLNGGDDGGEGEEEQGEERAAALPNGDLLRETDALVGLLEEILRSPESSPSVAAGDNRLVADVVMSVAEVSAAAEKEIVSRVRETGERLDCMGFGESVELTCLLRRLEGCKAAATSHTTSAGKRRTAEGGVLLWTLVAELKEKVEAAMVRKDMEERRKGGAAPVRRENVSESARIGGRVAKLSLAEPVRFGSTRWSES